MRLRVLWEQPGSISEGFQRRGREYPWPSRTESGAGAGDGGCFCPLDLFEVLCSAYPSCAFLQGKEDKL